MLELLSVKNVADIGLVVDQCVLSFLSRCNVLGNTVKTRAECFVTMIVAGTSSYSERKVNLVLTVCVCVCCLCLQLCLHNMFIFPLRFSSQHAFQVLGSSQ